MGGSWDVVGRYERSFFIASRDSGTLLSLVRGDLPNGPYTVRLDKRAPRDMRTLATTPLITWREALTWRPRMVSPAEAAAVAELARRAADLELLLATNEGGSQGARTVVPAADAAALERAIAADDATAAAAAAAPIAGRGPGLTPSGDDLLAGLLAVHAWAEAAGLGGAPGLRGAVANASVPRTTRLAGQLLDAAADGCVTAPLADLLTAILRRDGRFEEAVPGVLAIGATSGADLLFGVEVGARAIARRESGERRIP